MEIKMVDWFDDHWYRVGYDLPDGKDAVTYIASVSSKLRVINKPFLARWRGDVGNEAADRKLFQTQHRGSRIHDGWNRLTTGGIVIYNPFERRLYQPGEIEGLKIKAQGNLSVIEFQDEAYDLYKLQRWLEIVKPKIIASELMVVNLVRNDDGTANPILSDAGTLDNIFEIEEGEYAVAGSKPLYIPQGRYIVDLKSGKHVGEVLKQESAYRVCAEFMNLGPINGGLCIHTQASTRTGIEGLTTYLYSAEELDKGYELYRHAAALWESENQTAKPKLVEFPSLLTIGDYNEHHGEESKKNSNSRSGRN